MSINILHISDLHFGTKADSDKTRYSESFVKSFIESLEKNKIDYLIVSGDIANKSKEKEYKEASTFLNKVVSDLKIPKKNVIICMGNHDVSWRILEDIADDNGAKDVFLREEKYNYFKSFYNGFYYERGKQIREFKSDSIFVTIPDDIHRILFLGVNTCFHESNLSEDHYGFIEENTFIKDIENIDPKYHDYVKCLVMHHNPKDLAKEAQHNVKNWREITQNIDFGYYPVVVFCGHIHSSDGESVIKSDENNAIHYISVGSLLQRSTKGKYNLYTITDDSFKLKIQYFDYEEESGKCYWQDQSKKKSIRIILLRKRVQKNDALTDALSDSAEKTIQGIESSRKMILNESNNTKSPQSIILDIIKNYHLFYSGHFHWDTDKKGDNSKFKSHGYIDINYLVSHSESLEAITRLYKEKLEKIKKEASFGKVLMVSIGLECNVIGARLSVLFPGFDYSYIPRKREKKDHNDVEDEIGFSGHDTVVLIKDITFNAEEVVEIIEERFSQKSVYVISLFYCGKQEKKEELLIGVENAYFHSLIDDIKIPQCDMPETECPIINNKLQTIYRC